MTNAQIVNYCYCGYLKTTKVTDGYRFKTILLMSFFNRYYV